MLLRQCISAGVRNLCNQKRFALSHDLKLLHGCNRLQSTTAVESPAAREILLSKVDLAISGADPAVLKSYSKFVQEAARCFGISLTNCVAPAKARHDRLTLLKSIHIYKKHRVQYEVRTYSVELTLERLTGSTSSTFLEYIQRNLPEGVALKTSMTELISMPGTLQVK